MEIGVTNESDLGVGEASARLDIAVAVDHEGNAFESSGDVRRRTRRSKPGGRRRRRIRIGGVGDLDPVAELAAMVDTFG